MNELDRSTSTFVLALVVVALLGASFAIPWFLYSYSSGAQAPPGGPQADNATFVETARLEFFPYHYEGNATPDDARRAEQRVDMLGLFVAGGIGAAGLVALLEIPIALPFGTRRWSLLLSIVGFELCVAALAWTWLVVPASVEGSGIDGAFSSVNRPDGYGIARLDWGWATAGLATLGWIPLFAMRFQTGVYDPAVVESFRAKPPNGE